MTWIMDKYTRQSIGRRTLKYLLLTTVFWFTTISAGPVETDSQREVTIYCKTGSNLIEKGSNSQCSVENYKQHFLGKVNNWQYSVQNKFEVFIEKSVQNKS